MVDRVAGDGGTALRSLEWPVAEARGVAVVVHGFSEHAGRYDLLAEALNDRHYSVFAYDQRGHGASPGQRGVIGDFGEYVLDLASVLEDPRARASSGSPFLLGHSMGGLVALRTLQTVPVSLAGAVLSAPWLGTALDVPAWKRLVARLLLRMAPDVTLPSEIRPERLTRDPARAREYATDPLVHHRMSARHWAEVRRAQRDALGGGLPRDLPTLVLLPGADPVTDVGEAERWASSLDAPLRKLEWLPDRLHEPFNDIGRSEVFTLIADWLDEVGG